MTQTLSVKKAYFGALRQAPQVWGRRLLRSTRPARTASHCRNVLGRQGQTRTTSSDLHAQERHRATAWLLRCACRLLSWTSAEAQDGSRHSCLLCTPAGLLSPANSHLCSHGQLISKCCGGQCVLSDSQHGSGLSANRSFMAECHRIRIYTVARRDDQEFG